MVRKELLLFLFAFVGFTQYVNSQTIVSTAPSNRCVVLEMFTGGYCQFCPDAHRRSDSLCTTNPDSIFDIRIHWGTYAPDFNTQWGYALANNGYDLLYYPSGSINRHKFIGTDYYMLRQYWPDYSDSILQSLSPVNIAATASINSTTRMLTVNVELYYTGNSSMSTNYINVALLQNNIIGNQQGGIVYYPDMVDSGGLYRHMHILRHLLTGQWGDAVNTTTAGTFVSRQYTYAIPDTIVDVAVDNLCDLEVIAFIAEGHREIITGCRADVASSGNFFVNMAVNDTTMGSVRKHLCYSTDGYTLDAIPYAGHHFVCWSDGITDNPRTVSITQDTTLMAIFDRNQYLLSLHSSDSTIGIVSGGGYYYHGDTAHFSATVVAPHHHFVQWSDRSTVNPRSGVMYQDRELTANFAVDSHHVIVISDNNANGVVYGVGDYPYGSNTTISASAMDGYHFVEWNDGNRDNPRVVTVTSDTSFMAYFSPDTDPSLCMVSVFEGHNMLVWNKNVELDYYNLYRESVVAGEYELVAVVQYDSLSQWIDTNSRPSTRSYRYRISGTDSYGYESRPSETHKTMHLTISQGVGNHWNLVWTEYEGADYTTYVIYRGADASSIHQIDVMPAGGNTTYTDEDAPEGDVYYQVGVMMSTPCNPEKTATISLSNIATNGAVGISGVDETQGGYVFVDGAGKEQVMVFDMLGRCIGDCSHLLPVGVYMVKVGNHSARKVVVIR